MASPTLPDKLQITTEGYAARQCRAERAVMDIEIESVMTQQDESLDNVKHAANEVQRIARSLQDAATPAEAPLTDWMQARLSTSSYTNYEGKGIKVQQAQGFFGNMAGHPTGEGTRMYRTKTTFTLRFQHFGKLSEVATTLATLPHTQIKHISWTLLHETRAALQREARRLAVQNAILQAQDFADAAGAGTPRIRLIEDHGEQQRHDANVQIRSQPAGVFATPGSEPMDGMNLEPGDVQVAWSLRASFVVE